MEICQNLLIGYNKIPTWIRLLEFNLLYFAGNICRSPIAEAVFKRLLAQEGKTDEVNHNYELCHKKSVFEVSHQVQHKPGCTATEDG